MSKEWKKDELLTSEAFNNIEEALTEINPEYVPHEWKAGDMISAERLNIIEEAIANASGGGDSDFSTAEVTVINSTSSTVYFTCPMIYTEHSTEALVVDDSVEKNTETTITAVLYKGETNFLLDRIGLSMTATGDIEIPSSLNAVISGDGTITISES